MWFCMYNHSLLWIWEQYIPSERLPSHSFSKEDKCHLEPGAKLSCCKAPAQPSYLLISSGWGQRVRQGRVTVCRHHGAQGPAHSPAGPAAVLLAHSPATKGQGRSHNGPLKLLWGSYTHSNTQTDTDAKLWTVEYKTEYSQREYVQEKGEKLNAHTLTHTVILSNGTMESF